MSLFKDHTGKFSSKRFVGVIGSLSCLAAMFCTKTLGISDTLIISMFIISGSILGVEVLKDVIAVWFGRQDKVNSDKE